MPRLSSRYCGIAWYFSNSACHCASLSGGNAPVTGFHSVIERPEFGQPRCAADQHHDEHERRDA